MANLEDLPNLSNQGFFRKFSNQSGFLRMFQSFVIPENVGSIPPYDKLFFRNPTCSEKNTTYYYLITKITICLLQYLQL